MGIRRPDFSRRVAVTGLGIISPVGQDIDTAWDNLVDGRSGLHEITRWDPTPYEAQARARSTTSTARSGWTSRPSAGPTATWSWASPRPSRRWPTRASRSTDDNRDDIGVIFGSGGGGPYLLMEQRREVGDQRRAHGQPVLHRQHAARHGVGPDRHRDGHPRLEHVHRHGLLDGHAQHRRGGRGHPPRRLHRGHHRRRPRTRCTRSSTSASSNMRGMGLPRAGRAARDRLAAVRQDAQRLRAGRGRRRDDARGPRVRQGARREGLRRGRRLRLGGRRVGPHPADREGRRRAPRDASRRSSATACRPTRSTSINPHGTSTPLGDLREAQAIWARLRRPHAGDRDLARTKSMTGHLMGAAGAVEGVFTVLSVYNQCAPATLNYRDEDPEINLNVVHGASRADGDPLRDQRQHRPRRPQRRGHLQALRRRLSSSTNPHERCWAGVSRPRGPRPAGTPRAGAASSRSTIGVQRVREDRDRRRQPL